MKWEAWVFVALYGFSLIANITAIGKPRQPLTPGTAAGLTVVSGVLIYLAVRLGVA